MIKLEFTIDQVNALLAILSKQPYEQVSMLIGEIIQQGTPQAKAIEDAKNVDKVDTEGDK